MPTGSARPNSRLAIVVVTTSENGSSSITEFRGAEVKSIGIDPKTDTALVEWIFDYTHKEWGDVKNHQVLIQRWRGDKIVHERFVYG